jgi:hypothetical protein
LGNRLTICHSPRDRGQEDTIADARPHRGIKEQANQVELGKQRRETSISGGDVTYESLVNGDVFTCALLIGIMYMM